MPSIIERGFGPGDAAGAVLIAVVFISLGSLIREPARRRYMAVFVGGAGAAYLNGGLGLFEFPFIGLMSYVAYRGLEDYRFIGAAWLLHTCWDVVHHLWGQPIVAFDPSSSAGCALTDSLLAVWFFLGAPSVVERVFRRPAAAG